MKKYTSNSTINFGKHKGFTLKEIYQYDPTYLEWLIKYKNNFIIDIKEFEQLPPPTPIFHHLCKIQNENSIERFGFAKIIPPEDITIEMALKLKAQGDVIKEIPFSFSNESHKIIEEKKAKNYSTPIYETMQEYFESGKGNIKILAEEYSKSKEKKIKEEKIVANLQLPLNEVLEMLGTNVLTVDFDNKNILIGKYFVIGYDDFFTFLLENVFVGEFKENENYFLNIFFKK